MISKDCVAHVIQGKHIIIRKPNVLEVWVDGQFFKATNCYEVLQAEIFENLLIDIVPTNLRTTEVVMKLYYDVQLLIDIAKQEFGSFKGSVNS